MRREASPRFKDLASRLLAFEAGEDETPEGLVRGAECVLRKLRARMDRLLTSPGFDTLLRRSLRLARANYPFLQPVQVQAEFEGWLKELGAAVAGVGPVEAKGGLESMLALTFDVTATFIGEDMVLRQLHRVWPEISPGDTGFQPQEAME